MEIHEFGQAVAAIFEEYVLRGGLTMAFLIPLSIFTLGVTLQRLLDLRPSRVTPACLVEAARSIKSHEEFHAFREGLVDDACPLAQVLLGYIEAGERGEPVHPDINREPIEEFDGPALSLPHAPLDRLCRGAAPRRARHHGRHHGHLQAIRDRRRQGHDRPGDGDRPVPRSTMWGLLVAVPAYYCFALLQRRIYRYERDVLPS